MAPTPISASLARALIVDACLAWHIPHLHHPACAVVSELASNAIEHAASDFEVTSAQVGRYVRVAVQDHSLAAPRLPTAAPDPQAPLADRGRGLHIVQEYATHWGTTPLDNGKIVWALLRACPVSGREPHIRQHPVTADSPMPPAIAAQPRSLAQFAVDRLTGIRTTRKTSGMSAVPEGLEASGIRPERLTEREVDVLRYLSTMLTVDEIATELDLSVHTVKAHMKSIYRKLDASRRREAVDRASVLGIIAPTAPADERPRG